MYADKAYNDYEVEDLLLEAENIKLSAMRKTIQNDLSSKAAKPSIPVNLCNFLSTDWVLLNYSKDN